MNCRAVRPRLAGYLDDTLAHSSRSADRAIIRVHLEGCAPCRQELQKFRKLSMLLATVPQQLPPADLAIRIKVAAAQLEPVISWAGRARRLQSRAELLIDNVFRPLTLPATGGFMTAILVFVFVFQMLAPGTTVRAVENDVPINLMRPAELVALPDYAQPWAPEYDVELALPHGLLVDVTVDARGAMTDYQILAGPHSIDTRHELDQILLFTRFTPMTSFGRPTAGGHVILSFSAIHVRG